MTFPRPAANEMDDLPRTLRREKEARLREARERLGQTGGSPSGTALRGEMTAEPAPLLASRNEGSSLDMATGDAPAATVTALNVPFFHLMGFFIKAAFAAIPAMILMLGVLWLFGQALETFFPELLKMKILISFPNS